MILLFVLAVTATLTEQANLDGLRRSRQLDLGLQDISNPNEKAPTTIRVSETLDAFQNGYLPPVGAPLPPKVVAAQSQQNYDFKSINAVKTEICKPPFDVIFCGLKEESSKSGIPKPSTDLVPPFNDLEENAQQTTTLKSEDLTEKFNDLSVYSAVSHSTFATTTRKPVTKQQEVKKETKKPTTQAPSTAEATNELRSYLPPQPEYSGAAQTNVGVVRAPDQGDHDHHHGHHDHHHGDICADAFHSFLCAPLKARKRITGALPQNLRGQSSFVQYQRVLPDKETAPSNTFQNEYLPPRPTASPSNIVPSTYAPPPTTTKRIVTTTTTTTTTPRPFSTPKVIPQSSNVNDRYYLPPLTDNRVLPVNPQPSNQVPALFVSSTTEVPSTAAPRVLRPIVVSNYSPILVSTAQPVTPAPVFSTSPTILSSRIVPSVPTFQNVFSQPSTVKPVTFFSPAPSNEDRYYLPPNPQPAASFVSTTRKVLPASTTVAPRVSSFPKFVSPVSNSIFSTPQPKFVSTTVRPVTYRVTQAPVTTRKPIVSFAPQPSNPDLSYLPPQPKVQSASNVASTTIRPTITTTRRPVTTTQRLVSKPSTIDLSYLPAEPSVQPAAAQISAAAVAVPQVKNPFHHGRDLCTDPFHSFLCVAPKPRRRLTGALPAGFRPESSNTNELRVKPAPSLQNENRVKPEKPLETAQSQNLGYSYPKPVNPFPLPSSTVSSTTPAPTTGYSYPKPDKIFPLPSQQQPVVRITTTKQPTTYRASEARVVTGYQYPKPEKDFPLPSKQQPISLPTTSRPSTGYSYPKPQKPFPLPTEQKEVRYSTPKPSPSVPIVPSSTNQVKGYEYPKPQQSFNLPEKKGYSYPKPEKRLELPTESRSESLLPQKNPSLNVLQNLGSAEFIPVNKLDKREDAGKVTGVTRRFGERLRKRERRPTI